MKKAMDFRELEVWKLGMGITDQIYSLTRNFPKDEVFGLSSQMRKAAVSIVSNISEGFNRGHNNEFRQFLYIALGSCAELETQVEVSRNQSFINDQTRDSMLEFIDHETRMLRNLIKKL